jgi:vacuolar-type H+-ATPase subunit B/Vma2
MIIEAHTLLTQARLLINKHSGLRFNDLNVVEMRQNQADLADAAFERMLAASDVPCLYSSSLNDNFYISSAADCDQNTDCNDASESSLKRAKTKNKRLATHLKLVVDNSDSILPVNPGDQ